MKHLNTDAFGREVKVGDYVAFTVKGNDAGYVQMGIVTKFTHNRVVLNSINTYGQTIAEYVADRVKRSEHMVQKYLEWQKDELATGKKMPKWQQAYKDGLPMYENTALHSLTSAVRIDPLGLPEGLSQILSLKE